MREAGARHRQAASRSGCVAAVGGMKGVLGDVRRTLLFSRFPQSDEYANTDRGVERPVLRSSTSMGSPMKASRSRAGSRAKCWWFFPA